MKTQWISDGERAVAALEARFPDLASTAELAHRQASSALAPVDPDLAETALPDLFRTFFTQRLRGLGLGDNALITELRNGIALNPEPGVRIRVLKAADDDGAPRLPGSRSRKREFEQQLALDLDFGATEVLGTVTLILSWTDSAAGLTLHLSLPRSARAGRFTCDTVWSMELAHPLIVSNAQLAADSEHEEEDLQEYKRREEQTGDEPA